MMPKKQEFVLNIPIYNRDVKVHVNFKREEIKYIYDCDVSGSVKASFIENKESGTCAIILYLFDLNNIDSLSLLCHESIHCSNYILYMAGISVDNINDEQTAYIAQYVFKEILNKITIDN